ncbi:hypothetical protein BJY24_007638 [Nocardia transvalensis]|uniref:Uncharacterized protein n=1 Tax=Nocardia transvalensis TaxID=37333 RepID=A0A7W9PMC5_9NOCA|nr:hypothetical protein [Nocardia transvalensis]MBB5918726.1 hypothetical protein [Nocardia transvalensis]
MNLVDLRHEDRCVSGRKTLWDIGKAASKIHVTIVNHSRSWCAHFIGHAERVPKGRGPFRIFHFRYPESDHDNIPGENNEFRTSMSAWDIAWSIVTTLGGCGVAGTAAGCAWPGTEPRRRAAETDQSTSANIQLKSLGWPREWTCTTPAQQVSLDDAHRWMQLHREHDCARKRAAFAALVAAGHITPDSSRRHRPVERPE